MSNRKVQEAADLAARENKKANSIYVMGVPVIAVDKGYYGVPAAQIIPIGKEFEYEGYLSPKGELPLWLELQDLEDSLDNYVVEAEALEVMKEEKKRPKPKPRVRPAPKAAATRAAVKAKVAPAASKVKAPAAAAPATVAPVLPPLK